MPANIQTTTQSGWMRIDRGPSDWFGLITGQKSESSVDTYVIRTKSDIVKNKNWKQKLGKEFVCSPYSHTTKRFATTGLSGVCNKFYDHYYFSNYWSSDMLPQDLSRGTMIKKDVIQLACTRAVAAAYDGNFDSITEVVELRGLIEYLGTNIERLNGVFVKARKVLRRKPKVIHDDWREFMFAVKNPDIPIPARVRKMITSESFRKRFVTQLGGKVIRVKKPQADTLLAWWMEYRYSISTTIYSIQDAIKAIEAVRGTSKELYLFRASSHDEFNSVDPAETQITGQFTWPPVVKTETTLEEKVGCFACYAVRFNSGTSHNLHQFGLSSPFRFIWEVTKLSFVMDWFVNIGDYVSAKTSNNFFLTPVGSYYTVKRTVTSTKKFLSFTSGDSCNGSAMVQLETTARFVTNINDLCGVEIDIRLNWKRVIDAIALGKGLISSLLSTLVRKKGNL